MTDGVEAFWQNPGRRSTRQYLYNPGGTGTRRHILNRERSEITKTWSYCGRILMTRDVLLHQLWKKYGWNGKKVTQIIERAQTLPVCDQCLRVATREEQ